MIKQSKDKLDNYSCIEFERELTEIVAQSYGAQTFFYYELN